VHQKQYPFRKLLRANDVVYCQRYFKKHVHQLTCGGRIFFTKETILFLCPEGARSNPLSKFISVMGQLLYKNYLHIVFSTKYRQPLSSLQLTRNFVNIWDEFAKILNATRFCRRPHQSCSSPLPTFKKNPINDIYWRIKSTFFEVDEKQ